MLARLLTSPPFPLPTSPEHYGLPFCKPADGVQNAAENLGEHLMGDMIQNSDYDLYVPRRAARPPLRGATC